MNEAMAHMLGQRLAKELNDKGIVSRADCRRYLETLQEMLESGFGLEPVAASIESIKNKNVVYRLVDIMQKWGKDPKLALLARKLTDGLKNGELADYITTRES